MTIDLLRFDLVSTNFVRTSQNQYRPSQENISDIPFLIHFINKVLYVTFTHD